MALHAHLHFESRDCDGQNSYSRTAGMTAEEKASAFGDLDFKRRMMVEIVYITAVDGVLAVEEDGVVWQENTEEGYRLARAEWCGREGC